MKVVFRTDSSLEIGSGHVMRCLTLAKALRDHGAECQFICRAHSGNLCGLIQEQGFAIDILEHNRDFFVKQSAEDTRIMYRRWLGAPWEGDASETIAAIGTQKPDWLVVDHYGIDHHWEAKLRSHCRKTMVIDDLADREHDCDILLDQNTVNDQQARYTNKVSSNCIKLLGSPYVLLQRDFPIIRRDTSPRTGPVRRMLVYFGGVDSFGLTASCIKAFVDERVNDMALDVVQSPLSPDVESVKKMCQGIGNITLYQRLPTLANLMSISDISVGAGGATTWERCCLGLPSFVVATAENQIAVAYKMNELGLIRFKGDAREFTQEEMVTLVREVREVTNLREWSSRCFAHVDGVGVDRVVYYLMM